MKQAVINREPFYATFSANLILACACLRLAIVRMALGDKLLAMRVVNFLHAWHAETGAETGEVEVSEAVKQALKKSLLSG